MGALPATYHGIPLRVGILHPDWLANATFLGRSVRDGRPVLGWTKVDFIDNNVDAESCEPVSWYRKAVGTFMAWRPGLTPSTTAHTWPWLTRRCSSEPPSYRNATVEAQ